MPPPCIPIQTFLSVIHHILQVKDADKKAAFVCVGATTTFASGQRKWNGLYKSWLIAYSNALHTRPNGCLYTSMGWEGLTVTGLSPGWERWPLTAGPALLHTNTLLCKLLLPLVASRDTCNRENVRVLASLGGCSGIHTLFAHLVHKWCWMVGRLISLCLSLYLEYNVWLRI